MKLAIMQPYFFPYIGYFQLMNAVDEFVVYDNIEFTKKGWINRNRILLNGRDTYISIPLKKNSDYADIKDRSLATSWGDERKKMLNRITEAYKKAPCYSSVYPLVEKALEYEDDNLFNFIFHSISIIKQYLEIDTKLVITSTLPVQRELKSEKKVIAICKSRNADTYINPIGGTALYQKENFSRENIKLLFLKTDDFTYNQYTNTFIPYLSIIDVIMFNTKEEVKRYVNASYSFIG